MYYVGFDVHKRRTSVAVITPEGELIESRIPSQAEAFAKVLADLPGPCACILEACSNAAYFYEELRRQAERVVVANPRKTKALAGMSKHDRVDARNLAKMLATGFEVGTYMPEERIRDLRDLVRHRQDVIGLRTTCRNRVHALLDRYQRRFGGSDLFGKGGRTWLRELLPELREEHQRQLTELLRLHDSLTQAESTVTARLEALSQQAPYAEPVRQISSIPGIGWLSALAIVAELGEPDRFQRAEQVAAYAGLVPRLRQSGESASYGAITKQGSRLLRTTMVQCACTTMRTDSALGRFAAALKARRHNGKVARVALARKMLELAWHLWLVGEEYREPAAITAARE